MNEEEKKAIETTKTIIEYAGDCYIPKQNREKLQILIDLVTKQQKEIENWEETENDYEHELARKDEEIKKQQKEIEKLKKDKEILYGVIDELKGE